MATVRVLLVDDNASFLAAARRHLSTQSWAEVVGTAATAAEAMRLAKRLAPDLILIDLMMPDMNGIEATRALKRLVAGSRVVILTLHDNVEYRYHGRLAGADGFMSKAEFESALPAVIERLFARSDRDTPEVARHDPALARAAIEQIEERLRLALNAGGMGIFDWNVETGVLTWSPEHARLFGLHLEQFDGSYEGFLRCVHPDDVAGLVEKVEQARNGQSMYKHKYRVVWPDESIHWILGKGRFTYGADGRAVRMTGVVMDVTESMHMLRELEEKKARLSAIFDHDPQCIKLLDEQGIICEINRAGVALLGLRESAQAIGRSMLDFVVEEYRETVRSCMHNVLRGQPGELEFQIERADGERCWVRSHSTHFTDPGDGRTLVLGVTSDITLRKQQEARLDYLISHDTLTGLPNRLLFTDRLQQAIIEARRHGRHVGVVLLDSDRFKNINDTLGHGIGDEALVAVAQRLRDVVRPSDTVARLGGDEFALVLADMARMEDAPMVVQRILDLFTEPFVIGGGERYLSASLGITLFPLDETDADALLRNADTAMFRAKEAGRYSYQFYAAEMTRRAHEDMTLEGALRHAAARDELVLHYQPVIDLRSRKVLGLEALLRWRHPERGLIMPAQFIPLAEESGLIEVIGEWALRRACAQMQAWHHAGHTDLHVAVNLSSRQFRRGDLVEKISGILADTGLEGVRLELELTESMLLTDADKTTELLRRLDALGVRFSIDDFGTGYSSLSYLKRFPIDVLKIDQSFVRDITTDSDDAAIVRAIITLGHSLGIQVVAEGVETPEQLHLLQAFGCDAVQGYYFSQPQPAEVIERLLKEGMTPAHPDHHGSA